MLVIQLQFLAGRYHSTPWGRNVNEGETEWPPSSYRLARALVDVWKRRRPDWPEERVLPLLQALSALPMFFLPSATAAHTRSYLSSNEKDPLKKQLVFDAFVALHRNDRVLMGFDSDLTSDSLQDLGSLLEELNYFGRSESWVQAKVDDHLSDYEWNCMPLSSDAYREKGEAVQVACLLPPSEYESLPYRPEDCAWLDALCLTSRNLLDEGWSNPPALHWVDYRRPEDALRPPPRKASPPFKARFRCAKYALSSRVLPRVQETASFAERIRVHLMGIHKRIRNNDPTLISQIFSGKAPNGEPINGHTHAFYLPLDEDGDGRLDHLLVFSSDPFDHSELMALDRLSSVWQPDRRPDVHLILVSLSAEIPRQQSASWVSATPFVTSRHYRKGRGTYMQWLSSEIEKECAFHGLPSPAKVEWIQHTLHTHSPIRWMEYIRSRKGMAPMRGHGCILSFEEPVSGPFAVGSLCHFGLGLFVPYEEGRAARTSSRSKFPGRFAT